MENLWCNTTILRAQEIPILMCHYPIESTVIGNIFCLVRDFFQTKIQTYHTLWISGHVLLYQKLCFCISFLRLLLPFHKHHQIQVVVVQNLLFKTSSLIWLHKSPNFVFLRDVVDHQETWNNVSKIHKRYPRTWIICPWNVPRWNSFLCAYLYIVPNVHAMFLWNPLTV